MDKNPTAKDKVALYGRVSTEDQAERGTIEGQREWLHKYADLHDLDVTGEYYDDGITGTLPLPERPEGARLMEHAAAGNFETVIVYRVDRLGRSARTLLAAHDALEKVGVNIRSATEPFDTSTGVGEFFFVLLSGIAGLEKRTITERMTMGRDRVLRDGKWTGGPIPFGYELDDDGHLVPNETQAPIAVSVFENIAEGSSATAEARRLNALGVPTYRRYGSGRVVTVGESWLPSRINAMIHNRLYAGAHVFKSRGGAIERGAPALVAQETWDKANAQLVTNRALSKGNAKHRYLLRGLIKCSDCGASYTGTPTASKGWRSFYYRCNSQVPSVNPEHAARCKAKYLPASWLEDLVWEDCRRIILEPGEALEEAREQLQKQQKDTATVEAERKRLEKAVSAKESERERVMTLFRKDLVTLAEAESQLETVRQEQDSLLDSLNSLRSQEEMSKAYQDRYIEAESLLRRLKEQIEDNERENDWDYKRMIVEGLGVRVNVHTVGEGSRKRAQITISYTLGNEVVSSSGSYGRTPGKG